MCLQEPGSFTSIIAAIVRPRKTSSETIRPARAGSAAVSTFETGASIVSAVAMRGPSACGDTTARCKTPQCRGRLCCARFWPGTCLYLCCRPEGRRHRNVSTPNCYLDSSGGIAPKGLCADYFDRKEKSLAGRRDRHASL